jgi:pyrophosphatase PpaX
MYQYILFDWDGCLVKTLDVWLQAYKTVIAKENLFPSDKEIINQAFGNWEQGLKNLGAKDSHKVWNNVVKEVKQTIHQASMYKETLATIKRLKLKRKVIAILTSSDRQTILPSKSYQAIKSLIDLTLTRDDVVNGKPNPEIINTALKMLKGNKKEAIMIGDSSHDIQTGKNANVATAIFYPKNNHKFYNREELKNENPDFFFNQFKDILQIVK